MDTSKSRRGSPGVNGNREIWGTQASVSGCREGREENCSFSCRGPTHQERRSVFSSRGRVSGMASQGPAWSPPLSRVVASLWAHLGSSLGSATCSLAGLWHVTQPHRKSEEITPLPGVAAPSKNGGSSLIHSLPSSLEGNGT